MRTAVFVLAVVLVSGQQFQQSRPPVSPAVLLASNARTQQERLFQQSQDSDINSQAQFNTVTNSNFDQTLGVQTFGNSESRRPILRQNVGIQNRPAQARTTLFSSRSQEERSQQTRQDTQFINQKQLLRQSQDSFPVDGVFEPLNLPSGAYFLMGQIDISFSCADRPYGYYADQGNDCRVFHVCNPYLFTDGRVVTQQYSFMCNEHTVFDQKTLTCVTQSAASPCQESSFQYSRNEEFGLPEEKI